MFMKNVSVINAHHWGLILLFITLPQPRQLKKRLKNNCIYTLRAVVVYVFVADVPLLSNAEMFSS